MGRQVKTHMRAVIWRGSMRPPADGGGLSRSGGDSSVEDFVERLERSVVEVDELAASRNWKETIKG